MSILGTQVHDFELMPGMRLSVHSDRNEFTVSVALTIVKICSVNLALSAVHAFSLSAHSDRMAS
jgi:hypothetical protein